MEDGSVKVVVVAGWRSERGDAAANAHTGKTIDGSERETGDEDGRNSGGAGGRGEEVGREGREGGRG